METMNATLDERKYRRLLSEALPVVVHTEIEHERLLRQARELMDKPEEEMSEEEGRVLEMLSILIEEYEDRVHPLPKTDPHKMLKFLLDEKDLRPSDLSPILPKSRVSEILSGKRGISKTQARQLAEFFHVPVSLFV
jgi:HTH-type transcriptional regulator/antitoxin HigA